jgi:hypothetical protein
MTSHASSLDIRTYALAGAQAQLNQLNEEREQIRRLFPELRNGAAKGRSTRRVGADADAPPSTSRLRSRRTMSAAQRKAVGERMKKYWASRRGGTATDTPVAAKEEAVASKRSGAQKRRGPRTMSAEARTRISEAQKARWAKQRGLAAATASESKTSAKTTRRGKSKLSSPRTSKRAARKMSPAARKRMSDAQKKRWAAKRAKAA